MEPIKLVVQPKSSDDTSESTRNVGSAKVLSGRIFVLSIFVAPPSDPWLAADIERQKQKVFEAERWLKNQAMRYGKRVEFVNSAFGSDGSFLDDEIPEEIGSNDTYSYPSKVLLKVGFHSKIAFMNWAKTHMGCPQCLAIVFSNSYGRSFASPVTKELFSYDSIIFNLECCFIYRGFKRGGRETGAAGIAHEMLHLFGAWDLYELDSDDHDRANKTSVMFPNSIMIGAHQDIWGLQIDEITAWLVGLKEEGKDWYRWFEPGQDVYEGW